MTTINYAALKRTRKPLVVASEYELPEGEWVPISIAAKELNLHPYTVRVRWLTGKIEGCKIGENGTLLVNLQKLR